MRSKSNPVRWLEMRDLILDDKMKLGSQEERSMDLFNY